MTQNEIRVREFSPIIASDYSTETPHSGEALAGWVKEHLNTHSGDLTVNFSGVTIGSSAAITFGEMLVAFSGEQARRVTFSHLPEPIGREVIRARDTALKEGVDHDQVDYERMCGDRYFYQALEEGLHVGGLKVQMTSPSTGRLTTPDGDAPLNPDSAALLARALLKSTDAEWDSRITRNLLCTKDTFCAALRVLTLHVEAATFTAEAGLVFNTRESRLCLTEAQCALLGQVLQALSDYFAQGEQAAALTEETPPAPLANPQWTLSEDDAGTPVGESGQVTATANGSEGHLLLRLSTPQGGSADIQVVLSGPGHARLAVWDGPDNRNDDARISTDLNLSPQS